MPPPGTGETKPIIADDGMSAAADFNSEYMLESDDGSPLPYLDFDSTSDTLQFLDSTRAADPKSFVPATETLAAPQPDLPPPHSLNGSQDSLSDSSSSKRADSATSSKSTFTGGDVMMSDAGDVKAEWKFEDFVNGDDDTTFADGDGTVNPSSIENSFSFGDHPVGTAPNPASTSDSPSPGPFVAATDGLSPHAGRARGANASSPFTPASARRRNKALSVSWPLAQTSSLLLLLLVILILILILILIPLLVPSCALPR